MLIVPGAAGEIGVLARHAPLVATLKAGSTRVHARRRSDVLEFATGPGFFKVQLDRAIALVDDAVDVEGDRRRARASGSSRRRRRSSSAVERGRVERRPLAARAADQARREPALRRRPRLRTSSTGVNAVVRETPRGGDARTLLAVFDVDDYPDYRPRTLLLGSSCADRGHRRREGGSARQHRRSSTSPTEPRRRRVSPTRPARHGLRAHPRGARAGRRGRRCEEPKGSLPAARGRVAAVRLRSRAAIGQSPSSARCCRYIADTRRRPTSVDASCTRTATASRPRSSTSSPSSEAQIRRPAGRSSTMTDDDEWERRAAAASTRASCRPRRRPLAPERSSSPAPPAMARGRVGAARRGRRARAIPRRHTGRFARRTERATVSRPRRALRGSLATGLPNA